MSGYDVYLFVISDSGNVQRGKQISLSSKTSSVNTYLGNNVLRKIGDSYIFAGYATGYYTKINSATFPNGKSNSFVMKYLFDKDSSYSCIYETEINANNI
jgi:hypothetical protein